MVELALDGVRKEYGTATALDGVDLTVEEGEFFTLVGPSGCGKTTTLRLIAGFEEPTTGTVRFGGDDMSGVPPEGRGVGVVFQNYALFPHMSVAENVAYGLRFADPPGGASRDERVSELLELVDLGGMSERSPDELSGGQQQRVALARALAPGPRLLLLDEPMSALDAQLRERLRVQVKDIQSELGITTVYVTHDQEEALAISDRLAVMNDGRVEGVGEPEAIYERPPTRFAAEFIGDNNVLTGTVQRVPDGQPVRDSRSAADPEDVSESPGETKASHSAETAESQSDRMVAVEVHGRTFRVPLAAFPERPGVGDQVTLCIRPEYLHVDEPRNQFTVRVEHSEYLGTTRRVHCDWDGTSVTLRTDAKVGEMTEGDGTTAEDGEVTVGFDPADAHVLAVE